jgi:hypothetical protein
MMNPKPFPAQIGNSCSSLFSLSLRLEILSWKMTKHDGILAHLFAFCRLGSFGSVEPKAYKPLDLHSKGKEVLKIVDSSIDSYYILIIGLCFFMTAT